MNLHQVTALHELAWRKGFTATFEFGYSYSVTNHKGLTYIGGFYDCMNYLKYQDDVEV